MRRRDALLLPLALGPAVASRAAGAAEDPVVLSLTGRLRPPGVRHLTLADLEGLGLEALNTVTPWTRSAQPFSGVPLRRLLEAVGVREGKMLATAVNRYSVVIPAEDAWAHGAFLATRVEGRPMRLRDRGPIWLLYPWSERAELDRPIYHERAIWQLRQIEVW